MNTFLFVVGFGLWRKTEGHYRIKGHYRYFKNNNGLRHSFLVGLDGNVTEGRSMYNSFKSKGGQCNCQKLKGGPCNLSIPQGR